ncbi:hypothetical protein AGMMS49938_18310 [Fibrobacterales bacterium]|nr:hypothetical protein AGMMS49938_18310 [Fibrobacterales bacterium]
MPGKHYMVDTTPKINQILAMIGKEQYFTINRARQYGKTTTLHLLELALPKLGYECAFISFEGIGDEPFESAEAFCPVLLRQIARYVEKRNPESTTIWRNDSITTFEALEEWIAKNCKDKKFVLMIDEVDKTSNNQVFLRFVGVLRNLYLRRGGEESITFQSVILAGVYDIKNLKVKLAQAGQYTLAEGESRINSPWNIAVEFNIDMSFSAPEIATMLNEYESDHHTGMDIKAISEEIYYYTSGYPFLVSRICKAIDEDFEKKWSLDNIQLSIKELMLTDNVPLFTDMMHKIEDNKELKDLLYKTIVQGESYEYSTANPAMQLGVMFGILAKKDKMLSIGNKIFETYLCDYFISINRTSAKKNIAQARVSEIIENGVFNMELCLKKFAQHYYELYNESRAKFLEDECRILFLTYLRPLINGWGFYHIESETRDNERMDIVVDYVPEQFILELKIWRGDSAHKKAYEQLGKYLDSKGKDTGYLLTFDFRHKNTANRTSTRKKAVKWIKWQDKKIFDVMV